MCRQAMLHPETQEESFLKEEKGERWKTFAKSFGSFFLIQCIEQLCMQPSSVSLMLTLFEEKIFEGRELIWDAVSCPVPPDVILFDLWSNSHDCFWGAVTHNCSRPAAKVSEAVFPCLFVAMTANIQKIVNTT